MDSYAPGGGYDIENEATFRRNRIHSPNGATDESFRLLAPGDLDFSEWQAAGYDDDALASVDSTFAAGYDSATGKWQPTAVSLHRDRTREIPDLLVYFRFDEVTGTTAANRAHSGGHYAYDGADLNQAGFGDGNTGAAFVKANTDVLNYGGALAALDGQELSHFARVQLPVGAGDLGAVQYVARIGSSSSTAAGRLFNVMRVQSGVDQFLYEVHRGTTSDNFTLTPFTEGSPITVGTRISETDNENTYWLNGSEIGNDNNIGTDAGVDIGGVAKIAAGSTDTSENGNNIMYEYLVISGRLFTDAEIAAWHDYAQAPLVVVPSAQAFDVQDVVSLQITATAINGANTLSYALADAPSPLAINSSTGEITGTIDADQAGNFVAKVTVTDTVDSEATAIYIPMLVSNSAPTVADDIDDFAVDEDDTITPVDLTAVFADAEEASAALGFTVESNDNPTLVTADIDGTDLTLVLGAGQNGTAVITVRATDGGGLYVEDTFTLTVNAAAGSSGGTGSDTGGGILEGRRERGALLVGKKKRGLFRKG
jgi:hypothetical protein